MFLIKHRTLHTNKYAEAKQTSGFQQLLMTPLFSLHPQGRVGGRKGRRGWGRGLETGGRRVEVAGGGAIRFNLNRNVPRHHTDFTTNHKLLLTLEEETI